MKINSALTVKGLNRLQEEIERYGQKVVTKQERVIHLLQKRGYQVVVQNIAPYEYVYDYDDEQFKNLPLDVTPHKGDISTNDNITVAKISLNGSEAVYLEFGTGVFDNDQPSSHPRGAELGMRIGEKGYGLGRFESWNFTDDEGHYVRTNGIKAQMPLEKAYIQMLIEVQSITKRVYNS